MTFPEKIKRLMLHRGLSQQALADAISETGVKVSQRAVSGWLQGSAPRPEVLRTVAQFFRIPLDVLVDDEKNLPLDEYLQELEADTALVKEALPGNPQAQLYASDLLDVRRQLKRNAERLVTAIGELVEVARDADPHDRRLDVIHRILQRKKPHRGKTINEEVLEELLEEERRAKESAPPQSSTKLQEGAGR